MNAVTSSRLDVAAARAALAEDLLETAFELIACLPRTELVELLERWDGRIERIRGTLLRRAIKELTLVEDREAA